MASKHRSRQQQVRERRTEVAKLRLAGLRNQQRVADRLGVSVGTINSDFKALDAEWREAALRDTDKDKATQNERYEALIAAHWSKAMDGKGFDTDRVLAAMAQQAKLLGLDAPVQSEQSISGDLPILRIVGVSDEELGS